MVAAMLKEGSLSRDCRRWEAYDIQPHRAFARTDDQAFESGISTVWSNTNNIPIAVVIGAVLGRH